MQYFLVPYAYDYIKPAKGTGKGTSERILRLLMKFSSPIYNTYPIHMILTAGYTKHSPTKPTDSQKESLAEQMERFTRRQTWFSRSKRFTIVAKPLTWGTLGETEEAIQLIQEHASPGVHVVVEICSSPAHLWRVRLCWALLPKPKEWEIKFVKADHRFTKKEILQECVKCAHYAIILLKRKLSS